MGPQPSSRTDANRQPQEAPDRPEAGRKRTAGVAFGAEAERPAETRGQPDNGGQQDRPERPAPKRLRLGRTARAPSPSSESDVSELEYAEPHAAPEEKFRVNITAARPGWREQVRVDTPVVPPAPIVLQPRPKTDESLNAGPPHDLGIYSHGFKLSRRFHQNIMERVGLSENLAYGISGIDKNAYDHVVSPDRIPFLTPADNPNFKSENFKMLSQREAFILAGTKDGLPVYAAMTDWQMSKASPVERKLLGTGITPPTRTTMPGDSARPFFSRNFALMDQQEKYELIGDSLNVRRPSPMQLEAMASRIAEKMGISKAQVKNARHNSPLMVSDEHVGPMKERNAAVFPVSSNQCLLVSLADHRPTYLRLTTDQASRISDKERNYLGYVPSWTRGLWPDEQYRLGLIPGATEPPSSEPRLAYRQALMRRVSQFPDRPRSRDNGR